MGRKKLGKKQIKITLKPETIEKINELKKDTWSIQTWIKLQINKALRE